MEIFFLLIFIHMIKQWTLNFNFVEIFCRISLQIGDLHRKSIWFCVSMQSISAKIFNLSSWKTTSPFENIKWKLSADPCRYNIAFSHSPLSLCVSFSKIYEVHKCVICSFVLTLKQIKGFNLFLRLLPPSYLFYWHICDSLLFPLLSLFRFCCWSRNNHTKQ